MPLSGISKAALIELLTSQTHQNQVMPAQDERVTRDLIVGRNASVTGSLEAGSAAVAGNLEAGSVEVAGDVDITGTLTAPNIESCLNRTFLITWT